MQHENKAIKDFEAVFRQNYEGAVRFAFRLIDSLKDAEDMVQQSFLNLWQQQKSGKNIDNNEAYLFRTVHNLCINHLKRSKRQTTFEADNTIADNILTEHQLETRELQEKISVALEKLPPRCKTIFLLSRYEQLKYQQIADKMGLSIKTVETQMSKALHILRKDLQHYLPLILIITLFKN